MKKMTAGILTGVLVIALGGATVSAVAPGQTGKGAAVQDRTQLQLSQDSDSVCDYSADGNCRGDSDGDGICDYHEDINCRGDSDGDGICDYREDGSCRADSDGDGICDYRENGTASSADDTAWGSCGYVNGGHHSSGSGSGLSHGYGHGHGCR